MVVVVVVASVVEKVVATGARAAGSEPATVASRLQAPPAVPTASVAPRRRPVHLFGGPITPLRYECPRRWCVHV